MSYYLPAQLVPRLPTLALWSLVAIYLLAGVTGHDPWKTEDVIHIDIAHSFLTRGDWSFPFVAGEPWPHTAPLYHWIAALLGKSLEDFLDFHDGARLATTLFSAMFLFFMAAAARTFHGEAAGRSAPLLAIGTLGLLLPFHEAQPAVAGLAFAALAYWGAALLLQGQTRGALILGVGLGLAFPAHGIAGLVMAIAVLSAPTFRHDWKSLVLVLCIALPLLAAWPFLISNQSPELWSLWWSNEITEATTARKLPTLRHFEQLIWATWPVLPLAGWACWLLRQQATSLTMLFLGTALSFVWYLTGSPRPLAILPMLPPLILLAAAGVERLRRGAANAFNWFGVMTFSFFAGLIWIAASAQALDWPARIARNFDKLAPGHEVNYSLLTLLGAATVSIAWLLLLRLPRAPWRPSFHWGAGLTVMWVLVATLLLSWINHGKTYRSVAWSLRNALPHDITCIERNGIGTPQRASLDYFAGIHTVPMTRQSNCNWRLSINDKERKIPAGWQERWQGHRPSDRKERWYLDQRIEEDK